ncbi:yeats-domain-containing protein [Microthyrium microscopicum]|uniref:Yeats-domain-containing protein n=1 Tax=Microthyrium microscopicum TaxID=703497 RepID=A0A6A6UGT4_9PEZI|nr:yeats-domain-containing protein [Microthyrium microscopicum]
MPDIKVKVKIVTNQSINPDADSTAEFPMRNWNIEVHPIDDKKETISSQLFEKVTFDLHPSFEKRAKQVKKEFPYRIEEEGWGEFEMLVTFTPLGKSPDISIPHDLNFAKNHYEVEKELVFKNPKADFLRALEEAGVGKKGDAKKRSRKEKTVDLEKLADLMMKLGEDDLLHVIQLIHDKKESTTYTKNSPDQGEYEVDLYTLPDGLVKELWEFVLEKAKS